MNLIIEVIAENGRGKLTVSYENDGEFLRIWGRSYHLRDLFTSFCHKEWLEEALKNYVAQEGVFCLTPSEETNLWKEKVRFQQKLEKQIEEAGAHGMFVGTSDPTLTYPSLERYLVRGEMEPTGSPEEEILAKLQALDMFSLKEMAWNLVRFRDVAEHISSYEGDLLPEDRTQP